MAKYFFAKREIYRCFYEVDADDVVEAFAKLDACERIERKDLQEFVDYDEGNIVVLSELSRGLPLADRRRLKVAVDSEGLSLDHVETIEREE